MSSAREQVSDVRWEPMSVQLSQQQLYKKLSQPVRDVINDLYELLRISEVCPGMCEVCPGMSEVCPGISAAVVGSVVPVRWRQLLSYEAAAQRPSGDLRAVSASLFAGRNRSSSRCLLPGFSRKEQPRVPVLLLRDMDLCYRLLRQLVPGLPAGRSASRVEILQHVIDYILDLQTELESCCPAGDCGEQRGEELRCDRQQQLLQRPQSGQSPGNNILTGQSDDFSPEDSEDEER